MKKQLPMWVIILALAISLMGNIYGAISLNKTKHAKLAEAEIQTDTLSQWDIFTLALMKVESEYDNSAVSSVGARGYFQMTPIYVREVNRVHNTNFTFDQVTDFDTAYQIFDLMQKAHNPDYNMDKALELHNGKHAWYNRRVYKEMKNIQTYENLRNRVKNI
jgi:hypothetical protein